MTSRFGSKDPDDDDRKWTNRRESAEEVRKRLRRGWRNDSAVLNQYFQSVYNNWKVHNGPRTPKQVLKLQAIYKQAIYGDINEPQPDNLNNVHGQKWEAWNKLKGMPQDMAKRRFITFLMEIDPTLIDVMPDERPPVGFPLDRKGNPICAKCNTIVGCSRPLLDQRKMNIRVQLFDNEEFHEPDKLREWLRNALANQRCVWGVHQPITKAEARPFMDWFDREENRGFFPYDSISLMEMVKDLVEHYYEVAYEMMQRRTEVDAHQYNEIASRVFKIKAIYEDFSGEKYKYEIWCTRDNESCNMKRIADGGRNHRHEVQIDPPTYSNQNSMEEAVRLRIQCQQLGLSPCTGVVKDLEERCNIYRDRIAAHLEALRVANEAKERNDQRAAVHRKEKDQVLKLSKSMLQKQIHDACDNNQVDHMRTLIHRGAGVNEESTHGITPLISMILNETPGGKIEQLIHDKADINAVNKYGLSAIMYSARLKDVRSVHILMKKTANVLAKGGKARTVLHHCTVHHSEEVVRVLVEYLKEGVGDSMRVVRFLDAIDEDGDSALILAASIRNTLMCHILLHLGANPNTRNGLGRTAVTVARNNGHSELADWLEKKVSAGAMKVETYTDIQFEKQARFGHLKTRDLLSEFGKLYLTIVQRHHSPSHPFVCPFYTRQMTSKDLQVFVDNHHRYFLQRGVEFYPVGFFDTKQVPRAEEQAEKRVLVDRLHELLKEMCKLLGQGYTYPNTESNAQPIALTPLMCAVLLSDIRSVRAIVREGGSAEYCNRDGITAIMLAAEIHDVDILVELLRHTKDLTVVDNQGYNVLAYAGALPLPSYMSKTVVEVLLEDEVMGVKYLNAVDILKLADGFSYEELKAMVEKNKIAASPKNTERYALFMNLLAKNGLSNMSSAANIHHHLKTLSHRLTSTATSSTVKRTRKQVEAVEEEEEEELDEYELQAKKLYEEELERKRKEEEEAAARLASAPPRCPLCTLNIPCAHFYKVENLLAYINQQQASNAEANHQSDSGHKKKFVSNKKIKIKNRVAELLEETLLNDRHTDRSLTLARKYMHREEEVMKETKMREEQAKQEQAKEEIEYKPFEEIDEYTEKEVWIKELFSGGRKEEQQESEEEKGQKVVIPDSNSNSSITKEKTMKKKSIVKKDSEREKAVAGLDLVVYQDNQIDKLDSSAADDLPSASLVLANTGHMEHMVNNSAVDSDNESRAVSVSSRKGRRVQFLLPDAEDENRLVIVPTDSSHDFSNQSDIINAISDQVEKLAIEDGAVDDSTTNSTSKGSNSEISNSEAAAESPVVGAVNDQEISAQLNPVIESTEDKLQHASLDVKEAVHVLQTGHKPSFRTLSAISKPRKLLLYPTRPIYTPTQSIFFTLHKIPLSAWLYIHLCPIQADIGPTFPSIALSLHAFYCLLSYVQKEYDENRKYKYDLTSLVNMGDWKIHTERCSLCFIGFKRYKNAAENNDGYSESNLCCVCDMKHVLYEKVTLSIPRMMRKNFPTVWPVHTPDPSLHIEDPSYKLIVHSPPASLDPDHQNIATENQLRNMQLRKDLTTPLRSLALTLFDMQEENKITIMEGNDAHSGLMSQITDSDAQSVDTSFSLSTYNTTVSLANPFIKPKELELLAYNVYKQSWEDAERLVRVCLNKFSINEGEGMLYTMSLFGLVADMYKTLGLFVLAQGMYIDLIDMAIPLLGFQNFYIQKWVARLIEFYYTFFSHSEAGSYVMRLKEKISAEVKHTKTKEQLLETIRVTRKQATDSMIMNNACYVQHIKPLYGNQNSSAVHAKFLNNLGVTAVYTLFASAMPLMQLARRLFIQYIQGIAGQYPGKDSDLLLQLVDFVDLCFRWRVCYDEDVRRLLVQQIAKNYLSKEDFYSALDVEFNDRKQINEPANRYRKHSKAKREHAMNRYLHAVRQHLASGQDFHINLLDEIVYKALKHLHLHYLPFLFNEKLWEQAGMAEEEEVVVLRGEVLDLCATMIQNIVRRFVAKRLVSRVRAIALAERKRLEEEQRRKDEEAAALSSRGRRHGRK